MRDRLPPFPKRVLAPVGYTLRPLEARRSRKTRQALVRLYTLPPGVPATTDVLGPRIQISCPRTFLYSCHEIWECQIYRLPEGLTDVVALDVGANVGLATIRLKLQYPTAKVTAFEADPAIAEMLRANLAAFGVTDVTVVNAAVAGGTAQDLYFVRDPGGTGGHLTREPLGTPARTVSLRDHFGNGVTFLKVDIEGAELEVIEDIRDRLHLVECAFFAYHSFVKRDQALSDLLSALEDAGMRYLVERGGAVSRWPLVNRPVHKGMDLLVNIFAHRVAGASSSETRPTAGATVQTGWDAG